LNEIIDVWLKEPDGIGAFTLLRKHPRMTLRKDNCEAQNEGIEEIVMLIMMMMMP